MADLGRERKSSRGRGGALGGMADKHLPGRRRSGVRTDANVRIWRTSAMPKVGYWRQGDL